MRDSEPIQLSNGQTLLIVVKDGRIIEFTWDMGLPHVGFFKRRSGTLAPGAWGGTISKIDDEVVAIGSKYFFNCQLPAPEWVLTAVRAMFK